MTCENEFPENVKVIKQPAILKGAPKPGSMTLGVTWGGRVLPVMGKVTNEAGEIWFMVGAYIRAADVEEPAPPPVDPPPAPPPTEPEFEIFQVTANKSLARFQYGVNGKDKPIMMIYPTESEKDMDKRIKFLTGALVEVYPEVIDADGEDDFYKMLAKSDDGKELFLITSEGVLI